MIELEDMIAAAIEKALAKQAETQAAAPVAEDMVKKAVDAAVAVALAAQKAEFDDMAQKAVHLDRQGTGSRTSQANESTLESDPLEHLTRKARTIKSDAEWTPEEQAYISQIFHAVMVEGMMGE